MRSETQELYFDFSGGYHDDGSELSKVLSSFYNWEGSNSVISGIEANGFKSRVRKSTLEFGNHESHACYSKICAYHGLILVENAIVELGEDVAANTEMHLGLDGHVVTLPVDRGENMNVVACTVTKEGWADPHRFARAASEQDKLNELTSASKNVTNILSLLNGYVDTWVIFDMLVHPASTYAKERKVSIGDAAHSTSPYHGSGAGFANEDFAVLAELLVTPAVKAHNWLRAMFQAFELCRSPRTQ
ncbi:hypothetical protein BOTNAR_0462g00080 [Botryotinia narcissicola]|uniref:FAD-binding domain-containing protein n=1 Tax=Botryotinia narcissicola TaxID=278944 RepID=A0A4Z1HI62_9HELO|nr:hypothetical protein BOTNAR_0462g00080 [Botryotinia narcissicola]